MDFIDHRSTANFIFSLSATDEKFRITNNGDVGIGTSSPSTKLEVNGVITTAGLTTTADINFGDNDKAIFGAGSDLEIFSDGTNGRISLNSASGNLRMLADEFQLANTGYTNFYLTTTTDDAVRLFYGGSQKFTTTSTGIDVTGVITTDGMTTSADINFGDNDKAIFGAGSDLQIYHDGSNSYIDDAGTGALQIRSNGLYLQKYTNENMIRALADGAVSLYYDNAIKLETTSTGVDVTGNATFDDNGKAIFGAGSDLQIYHDGSNSYVQDAGTGNLFLQGTELQLRANNSMRYLTAVQAAEVKLYYNNSQKLATTSTGIDVTGTVTADGLTVDSSNPVFQGGNVNLDIIDTNAGGSKSVRFKDSTNTENGRIVSTDGDDIAIYTTSAVTKRLEVDGATGDISFYEDTGTTAKLFWDASAEVLEVNKISALGDQNTKLDLNVANTARVFTGGLERMRIDSSGQVGIGTSSPSRKLHVNSAGTQIAAVFQSTSTNSGRIALMDANTTADNYVNIAASGNALAFYTGASETVRISSGGNLLVGKSGTGINNLGIEARANGLFSATRDSANVGYFTRTTDDGDIVEFRKDTATVGSIGTAGGRLFIADDAQAGFAFASGANRVVPCDSSGTLTDATMDIGEPNYRFKDLYLSGISYSNTVYSDLNLTLAADYNNNSSTGNSNILFQTDGTERARIDSSGNLLVGKTSADNTTQGIRFLGSSGFMSIVRSNDNLVVLNRIDGDGTIMEFRTNGTTRGSISISGSTTSYNTSSDQRLKDNIVDAPSASDDIDAIQVRSFDWKADGSHQKYGMVAQELQSVAPEAVTGDADSDDMMGVDYSKLVPMMLKEIQSLRARVAELENN